MATTLIQKAPANRDYKLALFLHSSFSFTLYRETVLMCQMCDAITQGYMQPWVPALPPPSSTATPSKEKAEKAEKTGKGRQSAKGGKTGKASSKLTVQSVTVDPEAANDLKQALEVSIDRALG